MGKYNLLCNHGYYRDIFNYYEKSEEYQRLLALGITLDSDYPKDIFVSIPKDNIIYKKYGIYDAEIYLGKRYELIDGVEIRALDKDKFYMDYDFHNFIDRKAWTGGSCDYIITDINPTLKKHSLEYYYGMQFMCDMSAFTVKNNIAINIKGYNCLKSIFESNVKVDTPLLRAYSYVNRDDKEIIYDYIFLLTPNMIYSNFTKRLKSGIFYFVIPVSGYHIDWSIENIRLTMDLLLYYNKLLGDDGGSPIFKDCIIYLDDINDYSSFVSLDSLGHMSNTLLFNDVFDVSSILTNEFIDFILKSSGIKIEVTH